jgi:hypothetical protein
MFTRTRIKENSKLETFIHVFLAVGLLLPCCRAPVSMPSSSLSRLDADLDGDGRVERVLEIAADKGMKRELVLFEKRGVWFRQQHVVLGRSESGAEPLLLLGRAPAFLGYCEVVESGTGIFREQQRWFEFRGGRLEEVLAAVRNASQRGAGPLDAEVLAHVTRVVHSPEARRRPSLFVTYAYRFSINPHRDDAFVVRLDDLSLLRGMGTIRLAFNSELGRYAPTSGDGAASSSAAGGVAAVLTKAQWRVLEQIPGFSVDAFLDAFGDSLKANGVDGVTMQWLQSQIARPQP